MSAEPELPLFQTLRAAPSRPAEAPREEASKAIASPQARPEPPRPAPDPDGWPGELVIPIAMGAPSVPSWPDGVFPAVIGDYVDALTDFIQVPRDLAALAALGTLSACWAGKVIVSPFTGHHETLCLYNIVAAPVGERKTSTFKHIQTPIAKYQEELERTIGQRTSVYTADRMRLQAEIKRTVEDCQEMDPDTDPHRRSCERMRKAQHALDSLPKPPSASIVTTETTPEGLARRMVDTGGFAVVMAPEGGGLLDVIAGRYSDSGPNLTLLCQAYDAEDFAACRASGDRNIPLIRRPTLVIVAATQPSALAKLNTHAETKDRGLLARFLFSIPSESLVGRRTSSKPPIPQSIIEHYQQAVLSMLRVERPEGDPHVLTFDAEAFQEYDALYDSIERRLPPGGDLADMHGWGNKVVGRTVRIAGLLHLVEHHQHPKPWSIPMAGATFRRAALLVDYSIAHARRALNLMAASPESDKCSKVQAWLEREKKETFTTGQVHVGVFKNARVDEVRPILKVLADHYYIARITSHRRDQERWRVNPLVVRGWESPPPSPTSLG